MRRLILILARLYPRPWRERYGEEFDALLEDLNPSARTAFDIFTGATAMQIRNWNYGWMFAISAAVAATAFAAMLFAIPKTYVSKGVLVWNGEWPPTQADLDSLRDLVKRVESRPSLTKLVTSQNLYSRERSRMPLEDILELMRRSVRIEPARQGIVVSFAYSDPGIARQVTDGLLASFLEPSQGSAASLRPLDPASRPLKPTRSVPNIAAVSVFAGALVLGLLSLLRRRALRKA